MNKNLDDRVKLDSLTVKAFFFALAGMTTPQGISERGLRLVGACRKLYASIDRLDHEAATKAGVTRNDLRALNLLENGPVRAGHIAEELGLTTGAISSLIDRLERRGLATRAPDPDDRRATLVQPTPFLFEQLGPVYRQVAARLAGKADAYTDTEIDQALRFLNDVVEAYDAAAVAPDP